MGLLEKNGVMCPKIYCIIHQEVLCGKSIQLANVMRIVLKVTNLIRGGNKSLSHRKFKLFLVEMECPCGDLLLHCETRWLSAGKCLARFFALRR